MQILISQASHQRYLFDCVNNKPEHVIIASYGLYAGINWMGQDTTKWGEDYQLATRDLLEMMRTLPDVRLLIGVGEYRSCHRDKYSRCVDCEVKYVQALLRLLAHAELFPEFKWRMSTKLHLKCCLFLYGSDAKGVAGGRNFSDSAWEDVTFPLDKPAVKQLLTHVSGLWASAPAVSTEAVQDLLAEQEISSSAIQLLEA